jgi:hypothetical protein
MNEVHTHASTATSATSGPKTIKHPIGNTMDDIRTGPMNTRTNVIKFRCSTSILVRGRVEGNLIAPDEKRPVVVVRFRKNMTVKLRAR